MTDLDPEIWKNKTLGAATNGVFLDVLELQERENRAAAIEGRKPQIVKRENRYPGYGQPESFASGDDGLGFGDTYDDGTKVIPVTPGITAAGVPVAPPEEKSPTSPPSTKSSK